MTAAPAPIATPVTTAPRSTVRMHSSEIGPIAAATTKPRPKPRGRADTVGMVTGVRARGTVASMPLLELPLPEGSLEPAALDTLAEGLTAALLRAEGAPDNELFR